jgi:hypothetical protein
VGWQVGLPRFHQPWVDRLDERWAGCSYTNLGFKAKPITNRVRFIDEICSQTLVTHLRISYGLVVVFLRDYVSVCSFHYGVFCNRGNSVTHLGEEVGAHLGEEDYKQDLYPPQRRLQRRLQPAVRMVRLGKRYLYGFDRIY